MPRQEESELKNLPLWPDSLMQEQCIDHGLPSYSVHDWKDFMMKCIKLYPKHQGMIYRGQTRYDWKLSSTLSRIYSDECIPDDERQVLLKEYRLKEVPSGPEFQHAGDNEVWAYCQHRGKPTPLLDWTTSPFIALYFAFLEQDDDNKKTNPGRAIFCLNKFLLEKEEKLKNIFYEPDKPKDDRRTNQAGLFTILPDSQNDLVSYIFQELINDNNHDSEEIEKNMSKYFYKIHIPNIGHEECLKLLRQMNIYPQILLPDADNNADQKNDWLSRRNS
ncbi:MAG: FRG domain-containing protein [Gammaproteobacteria bacterium AqS3]|nr:FRG domain-containing protein [Gammaproteobacteria bacterium AqS3]